jgi:uncharacterized membrane-anchored protein
MSTGRSAVLLAGLGIVLLAVNHAIWQRQQIVEQGREVLLELRPADPRSLIQGDYMRLRYADQAFPDPATAREMPREGRVVLRVDADGVGRFAREDDGARLGPDELRLRYELRLDAGELRYGAETFQFQEGHSDIYGDARYGILRVGPDGLAVLIGLADRDRRPIHPPATGHG